MTVTEINEEVQEGTTRDLRQTDAINREALDKTSVAIVGCGAIGRQVALQMAAIGPHTIELIDPDDVNLENLSSQGFRQCELGQSKVEAVGNEIIKINPEQIKSVPMRDTIYDPLKHGSCWGDTYVFSCVDDMDVRRQIFTDVAQICSPFFADGRMNSFVMRALAVDPRDKAACKAYEATLFPQSEAEPGRCTLGSLIFTSNIIAGLLVNQFVRSLSGKMPLTPDWTMDILAMFARNTPKE